MPSTNLIRVHSIPNVGDPLDAWAGFDGLGFDGRLWVTTGSRKGHGPSSVLVHDDKRGDRHWEVEVGPNGPFFRNAETFAKLRDWTNNAGVRALYVFQETPPGGQVNVIRRLEGPLPAWADEGVTSDGSPVGGRALAVNYYGDSDLFAGWSNNWTDTRDGVVQKKSRSATGTGGWSNHRGPDPCTIPWELEFDDQGQLWEFWHEVIFPPSGCETPPSTLVNGSGIANPTNSVACVNFFPISGHMYGVGDLNDRGSWVRRYEGGGWNTVLTMSRSTMSEHVLYVPRDPGELWVVGQDPLQVYRSFDGDNWELILDDGLDTDGDTNQVCGIAYYCGRIWLLANDRQEGTIAVYREDIGSTCAGLGLQII